MSLTVVIPTLNEETDLPATLESVKNLADEVIVIDSGSTDKTLEIAKKYKSRIINHPFKSFSDTRNYADSKAKGDWILSIEADVTVPEKLAQEIKKAIKADQADAFYIGRENIIWGDVIKHTDWGPNDDRHIWLYRKGAGEWKSMVHEEFNTQKKISSLKNHLLHKNYDTISEFISKTNTYSDIALKQKHFFPFWWFARDFFKRYIYKLGFLDGTRGLFLSYLQSTYYLTLYVKKTTYETK